MTPFPALTLTLILPQLLVPSLGHRNFRVRESAHRAIATMGALARPTLERAAQSPDPEIRRRAQQLRAPWTEAVADQKSRRILPRHYPRLPWLDETVVGPEALLHYLALARGDLVKRGAPDWAEWREATRLWVRSQILQRRPRREILDTLDLLATAERDWIAQYGGGYDPPIRLPAGAPATP